MEAEVEMVAGMVLGAYPLNLYLRIFIVEKPLGFLMKNDVMVQGIIT